MAIPSNFTHYNTRLEKIIDEELNEWIETIKMPSGAVDK